MIPTFVLGLIGAEIPDWLKSPLKWLIDALIIAAIAGAIYAFIYHRGSVHGGEKVQAKIEKAHAKTVAEAKADSATAQVVTDAIGARVKRIDNQTTDLVRSKISEINDAIDSVPPAPAGAPPAVFPADRVSASLDALVDSANGAGEAADAAP